MPCIGEQSHGVPDDACHGFGGHEEQVDDNGHGVDSPHLGGVGMVVMVACMMAVMVSVVVIWMIVIVLHNM